jgi:hypothetical protein
VQGTTPPMQDSVDFPDVEAFVKAMTSSQAHN